MNTMTVTALRGGLETTSFGDPGPRYLTVEVTLQGSLSGRITEATAVVPIEEAPRIGDRWDVDANAVVSAP